jgi:hypothetical protein
MAVPTFAKIREDHPDLDPAYPEGWPKPSLAEIQRIESTFGVKYPKDFVEFQVGECHTTPMGDFAFDYFGWANPTHDPMENLSAIVADAQSVGVPKTLAPFRCDNGDYFCCTAEGKVVIWDHNSGMIEPDPEFQWPSFTAWLEKSFEDDE